MPRSLVSSEAATSPLTADRTVAVATVAQGSSGSLTPSSVFSPARLTRLKRSLFSAARPILSGRPDPCQPRNVLRCFPTFSFRGLNVRSYLRLLQVAGIYVLLLPVNGMLAHGSPAPHTHSPPTPTPPGGGPGDHRPRLTTPPTPHASTRTAHAGHFHTNTAHAGHPYPLTGDSDIKCAYRHGRRRNLRQ